MKRKGDRREAASEGSAERQSRPDVQKPDQAAPSGRASLRSRSPYPSSVGDVDPAGVRRRTSNLPQEVSAVPAERSARAVSAAEKSAEGIVVRAVGEAREALQSRKAEQQIGRTGNDGRRPERQEAASSAEES